MKYTVRRSSRARSISALKNNRFNESSPNGYRSGMIRFILALYYLLFSLLAFLRKISGMTMNTEIIAETKKIVGIGTNVVSP